MRVCDSGVLSFEEFVTEWASDSDSEDVEDEEEEDDEEENADSEPLPPPPDFSEIAATRAAGRTAPPPILPGNSASEAEATAQGHTAKQIEERKSIARDRAQMLLAYIKAGDIVETLDVMGMRDPAPDLAWSVPGLGATCLHFAIGNDQWRVASDLIDLGAPLDVQDSDGDTPLHAAVGLSIGGSSGLDFAVDLLGGGAKSLLANAEGLTPLAKAARAKGQAGVAPTHGQLIELLEKAAEEGW